MTRSESITLPCPRWPKLRSKSGNFGLPNDAQRAGSHCCRLCRPPESLRNSTWSLSGLAQHLRVQEMKQLPPVCARHPCKTWVWKVFTKNLGESFWCATNNTVGWNRVLVQAMKAVPQETQVCTFSPVPNMFYILCHIGKQTIMYSKVTRSLRVSIILPFTGPTVPGGAARPTGPGTTATFFSRRPLPMRSARWSSSRECTACFAVERRVSFCFRSAWSHGHSSDPEVSDPAHGCLGLF